jgi:hypothetical protein
MMQDQISQNGKLLQCRYDSMPELIEQAAKRSSRDHTYRQEWNMVESLEEALSVARDGWHAELGESLRVAEAAVDKVTKEFELTTFEAVHDVVGSTVDVGLYLSGEPECMVDMRLAPTVKAGRVITLCASVSRSGAISVDVITRRGRIVVALAIALSQLGYALEIWGDQTTNTDGGLVVQLRYLLQPAGEPLDVERVMFGLAHPAMSRALGFAIRDSCPKGFNGWSQLPQDPIEDLPEGTLYLPCLLSEVDIPDADKQLEAWLRQLGIIED